MLPLSLLLLPVIISIGRTQYAPQQYQQFQQYQQYQQQGQYQPAFVAQQPQQWSQQQQQQQQQPQQFVPQLQYQPQQPQLQYQPQQQIAVPQQQFVPQQQYLPQGEDFARKSRRFVPFWNDANSAVYYQQQQQHQQQLQQQHLQQQQLQQWQQMQYQQQLAQQQFAQRQPQFAAAQFQQQPQLQQQRVQVPLQATVPPPPPPNPIQQQFQQQIPANQIYREQQVLVEQQPKRPFPNRSRPSAPKISRPPTPTSSPRRPPRPPPPPPPPPTPPPVRAPQPPQKFIPYPSDIFSPLESQNVPSGRFEAHLVTSGSELESAAFEEIPVINAQPQPVATRPRRPSKQQARTETAPPRPTTPPPTPPPSPPPTQPAPAPKQTSVLQATMDGAKVEGEEDPNTVFLQCCKNRNVDKKCESRCNFDIMNKKVLTGMFLGTDPCPQSNGRDLLSCAAQDRDHSQCCIEKGVHETSAGNKCLGFCNMTPGNNFQADVSMLPCWAVLNDIKDCFQEYIEGN